MCPPPRLVDASRHGAVDDFDNAGAGLLRRRYEEFLPAGNRLTEPSGAATSRKCHASGAVAVNRGPNAVRALIPPPGTDGRLLQERVKFKPYICSAFAARSIAG
jgi:hypothetical protein